MARTWGWTAPYAVAIFFAIALGGILGHDARLKQMLMASIGDESPYVFRALSYGGALLLFWMMARRASRLFAVDGKAWTFLRTVLTPLAAVLGLVSVNRLFSFGTPAPSSPGTLHNAVFAVGMIGAALWVTIVWVRHAGALVKWMEAAPAPAESGRRERHARQMSQTMTLFHSGAPATRADDTIRIDHGHGRTTLGRYEILRELGRGSMGVVYLGKDPMIQRSVAIKTMRLDQDDDPAQIVHAKQRFFREAESTGRLSHPNIVTIYDAGQDEELGYIAMEVLEGQTLKEWCRKESLQPVRCVLEVAATVAEALDYAHRQGVVHRDIKPANIMMSVNHSVKVMDFGIARMTTSTKTQTSMIFGTPSYTSPEQLNGAQVDGRADIFSLGVVLFELLTGEKPFEADTMTALLYKIAHEPHPSPLTIRPELPPWSQTILDRALQKAPADRYQTAIEVARDLQDGLRKLPA